jgi:hypothetical protein
MAFIIVTAVETSNFTGSSFWINCCRRLRLATPLLSFSLLSRKMLEPLQLATLRTFTTYYRASFTFTLFLLYYFAAQERCVAQLGLMSISDGIIVKSKEYSAYVTYLTYSHGKGSGECAIMPAFAHPLA